MALDQAVEEARTEFKPLVRVAQENPNLQRFLGLLRESLHDPDMRKFSLVPALADMNIQFHRNTEPQDPRKYALTGATLNKASLEELLQLREAGANDLDLLTRLDEIMVSYTIAVALPRQIQGIYQPETANLYYTKFVSDYIKKVGYKLPARYIDDYSGFEDVLCADASGLGRGILGEMIVFCLLDKSGLNPRLSTVQEDMHGVDMYIIKKIPKGEKRVPIQVKADSMSKFAPFRIDNLGRTMLVAVNTEYFVVNNRDAFRSLLKDDPKASSKTQELFGSIIKDHIGSFV